MLPEKRNMVSPEGFDELFQKEARVIEFGSSAEEAEYEKRDSQLITRIRQEIKQLFGAEESRELFVDDEWWPDHTRRVEMGMRHFTTALLTALRSLLAGEYRDYRILISVYVNRTETELYIGSVALHADRALIERNLYLLVRSSELRRQFAIRYYLWATSEWEREIAESFPRLRTFKAGPAWQAYQFMHQLDRSDQLILAQSLLKRFHSEAIQSLGESCSEEEESLRSRLDTFRNQESAKEIFGGKTEGKKRKSASKKKLRTFMADKFQAAFGSECIGLPPCPDQDEDFSFEMKFSGWIIRTHFWFGRNASLIDYSHGISSEATFKFPRFRGGWSMPITGIGSIISFNSWLGISSQTEWKRLMNEDVEAACDAVIEHCRHFFAVAPKLLKGLELEKTE
jgi:hypothetical protein